MRTKKTYNHAYGLGFEVAGSKTKDGSDLTEDDLFRAVMLRILDLYEKKEMREAVGVPADTYEKPRPRRHRQSKKKEDGVNE